MAAFVAAGGAGFNVTAPCKGEAHDHADDLSEIAAKSEAVNTVVVREGRLWGDNTDGRGLMRDLILNLDWQIADKRVLVLGAGGAVRGVMGDLLGAGAAMVCVHNRTVSRAEALVQQFGDPRLTCARMNPGSDFDVILNGTSAGLGDALPDVPTSIFASAPRAYDMTYSAGSTTTFNGWAAASGALETADGLGMLVEQAALAFELWTGMRPDTGPVIRGMRAGTND